MTTLPRARLAAASRRKRVSRSNLILVVRIANNEKDRRGSRHLRSPGTREIERASVRVQVRVNNSLSPILQFSLRISCIHGYGIRGETDSTSTRRRVPVPYFRFREFRGLGHAVGSRFTRVKEGFSLSPFSPRTAGRRRAAVLSYRFCAEGDARLA